MNEANRPPSSTVYGFGDLNESSKTDDTVKPKTGSKRNTGSKLKSVKKNSGPFGFGDLNETGNTEPKKPVGVLPKVFKSLNYQVQAEARDANAANKLDAKIENKKIGQKEAHEREIERKRVREMFLLDPYENPHITFDKDDIIKKNLSDIDSINTLPLKNLTASENKKYKEYKLQIAEDTNNIKCKGISHTSIESFKIIDIKNKNVLEETKEVKNKPKKVFNFLKRKPKSIENTEKRLEITMELELLHDPGAIYIGTWRNNGTDENNELTLGNKLMPVNEVYDNVMTRREIKPEINKPNVQQINNDNAGLLTRTKKDEPDIYLYISDYGLICDMDTDLDSLDVTFCNNVPRTDSLENKREELNINHEDLHEYIKHFINTFTGGSRRRIKTKKNRNIKKKQTRKQYRRRVNKTKRRKTIKRS